MFDTLMNNQKVDTAIILSSSWGFVFAVNFHNTLLFGSVCTLKYFKVFGRTFLHYFPISVKKNPKKLTPLISCYFVTKIVQYAKSPVCADLF